ERVEKIEKGEERIDTLEKALSFGASLYTHNIQVSFAAFALGALTIAGGLLLLFYNGVILGAVAGMYFLDGVTTFFFAWVGPHGSLEIPAIVFGGAAGLRAGRALLAPGVRTQGAALREAFPSVWRMMLATALVLVLAGLIEGSFSQFSARTFPYALKIGVAAVLLLALLSWLFLRRLPEEA
ncbi:MAG TPA: stage II sporulation protein M, partial [Vicinamibacteria bacterium]|nr:stage II sporulation protein M [Vicinamibacteria bacterium]